MISVHDDMGAFLSAATLSHLIDRFLGRVSLTLGRAGLENSPDGKNRGSYRRDNLGNRANNNKVHVHGRSLRLPRAYANSKGRGLPYVVSRRRSAPETVAVMGKDATTVIVLGHGERSRCCVLPISPCSSVPKIL